MARAKKVAELTPELLAKITQWRDADAAVKGWKTIEFELRQAIVNAGFDINKLEGTETINISAWPGWKLKALKTQNYSATNNNGETTALVAYLQGGRPDLAAALVKFKPELSTKAYKELLEVMSSSDIPTEVAAQLKTLLAAAVTVKPGAPQLELIAPEEKKEDAK